MLHISYPQNKLLFALTASVALHLIALFFLHQPRTGEVRGETQRSEKLDIRLLAGLHSQTNKLPAPSLSHLQAQTQIKAPIPKMQPSAIIEEQTVFYSPKQLTVRPQFLSPPTPLLPESDHHVKGATLLDILLNDDGKVVGIQVLRSDFTSASTQLIVEAFRELRFRPGEIDGKQVSTKIQIEYTFDNGKLGM